MLGYGKNTPPLFSGRTRQVSAPPERDFENRPRVQGMQGLSEDQFAPLSTGEAKQTIKSLGGVRSAYLDSTWSIPDENVPRIQIIDRTMVGAGLITPEELVDIHIIGKRFEELRGDRTAFERKGNDAVRLDRAEREAIKQQKKAEAAERLRLHNLAVAERKATDIVFLGRGVSQGLSDRRSHVERLTKRGLAVLSTPAELASAMGLTIPRLRFLAFHSEAPKLSHYVSFTVPKKSGGTRTLSAPHRDMKAAQSWILREILSKLDVHPCAHGFVPAHSTVSNARPHVGADILINVDLSDFFGTIHYRRVRGLFQGFGYSPCAATILALVCTEAPRTKLRYAGKLHHAATGPRCLPQGAPTSPAISNLITRRMDQRLHGIAKKLGWTYTRYADDISFSARESENPEAAKQIGYVLAHLRHIAENEGFELNPKKTRVQRSNTRQTVTGLVVNDQVSVPRPTIRRMRAILHRAKTEGLEAQNREGREDFPAWVQGMVAYIEMVQPTHGLRLRQALNAL